MPQPQSKGMGALANAHHQMDHALGDADCAQAFAAIAQAEFLAQIADTLAELLAMVKAENAELEALKTERTERLARFDKQGQRIPGSNTDTILREQPGHP